MNTGPLGNPKIWVPDCSQEICSFYCPQWCSYTLYPPPPASSEDENPGPTFSPLFIAIIGILASALLIVSYYAILSKYCGNRASSSTMQENNPVVLRDNNDPSGYEPWFVSSNGLDEALIRSITVFKYKKGDGCLIQETECSVCLSEFEENQSLKLLPKCSHAFHVHCIDTWLKYHSNCPLCRANVALVANSPPLLNESLGRSRGDIENVADVENVESSIRNDDGCLP